MGSPASGRRSVLLHSCAGWLDPPQSMRFGWEQSAPKPVGRNSRGAPRNAPLPPTIAWLPCVTANGAPGARLDRDSPTPKMVPMDVLSAFKMSKLDSVRPAILVSAIAAPGLASSVVFTYLIREVYVPLTGEPLTAT